MSDKIFTVIVVSIGVLISVIYTEVRRVEPQPAAVTVDPEEYAAWQKEVNGFLDKHASQILFCHDSIAEIMQREVAKTKKSQVRELDKQFLAHHKEVTTKLIALGRRVKALED